MNEGSRSERARPPFVAERLVWDEATTRHFWEYYAQFPNLYFTTTFGPVIVRQLSRRVLHEGCVLDYGCGRGGLIQALLAAGIRAGGIDASATARAGVAAKFKSEPGFLGVWDVVGAEQAAPTNFDVLYFIEVIEHLDDAALAAAFASIRRLLKPGGWLICSTPNDENIEAAMVFCPVSGKIFHPMQHVRSWTKATLAAQLKGEGFDAVSSWTTDFGADPRYSPSQCAVRFAKRLLRFPHKDPHLVAIGRRGDSV